MLEKLSDVYLPKARELTSVTGLREQIGILGKWRQVLIAEACPLDKKFILWLVVGHMHLKVGQKI